MVAKILNLNCYFCGALLKSDDAHFEVFDQAQPPFTSDRTNYVRSNKHGGKELYGSLRYPGTGEGNYKLAVLFAHSDCGPSDSGYRFTFDRLGEHWDEQLRENTWWAPVIAEALRTARASMRIKAPAPRTFGKLAAVKAAAKKKKHGA
jgi:hypothetical protein